MLVPVDVAMVISVPRTHKTLKYSDLFALNVAMLFCLT